MANTVYTKAKERILQGAINFATANLRVALINNNYAPNFATDEFWSTVQPYLLNTPQTLTNKSVTGGKFDADDATFTTVTAGSTAAAAVLYLDTGTASTSPVLIYFDTIAGFPLATNGGDVTLQWDNGSLGLLAL